MLHTLKLNNENRKKIFILQRKTFGRIDSFNPLSDDIVGKTFTDNNKSERFKPVSGLQHYAT
jgi:hypothetical protein